MIINASSHRIPLADGSVHAVVTSPPYFGLRKYDGAQDVQWPAGTYAPMTGCPPCVDVPAMACPFGNEPTIEAYVWHSLLILRECRRVLRDDGVLWWNVGDSYNAYNGNRGESRSISKNNEQAYPAIESGAGLTAETVGNGNLLGIPHRVMLAAQADGWTVRNDCVWAKVAPMPESVKGWRFDADGNLTRGSWRHTRAHEYVFQLVKGMGYYCDGEAVKERAVYEGDTRHLRTDIRKESDSMCADNGSRFKTGNPVNGRNPRSVLTPPPSGYSGSHFAVFPPELIRPLIMASVPRRCCPTCGTAWAPVVEATGKVQAHWAPGTQEKAIAGKGRHGESSVINTGMVQSVSTTGSRPVCGCPEAAPVPGIVLDPFCGSGTTGEVARESLVRFIGLDISLPYLRDQASWRAERKVSAAKVEEMPLFAMGAK